MDTQTRLKESIAEKLAEVANESVSQFFDKGGCVDQAQIPILSFMKAVRAKSKDRFCQTLELKFPWLSEIDIALASFRVEWEGRQHSCERGVFLNEVKEDFELIESNLLALCHVNMESNPGEEVPIFVRILRELDPYTLNELEKFLRWQDDPAKESQLHAINDAWRNLCVKHEINLLRNQNPRNEPIYSWKAYFIARYIKRCAQEKGDERDALTTLLSLALLYDNRELLVENSLMQLADLETDTR